MRDCNKNTKDLSYVCNACGFYCSNPFQGLKVYKLILELFIYKWICFQIPLYTVNLHLKTSAMKDRVISYKE